MGRAREYAVQILFQLDVTGDDPDPVLATFWGRGRPTGEVVDFSFLESPPLGNIGVSREVDWGPLHVVKDGFKKPARIVVVPS